MENYEKKYLTLKRKYDNVIEMIKEKKINRILRKQYIVGYGLCYKSFDCHDDEGCDNCEGWDMDSDKCECGKYYVKWEWDDNCGYPSNPRPVSYIP